MLGAFIGAPGRGNQPLLLLFNAEPAGTAFRLPDGAWTALLDTAWPDPAWPAATGGPRTADHVQDHRLHRGDGHGAYRGHYPLQARSVVLLAGPPTAGRGPSPDHPAPTSGG